MDTKIMDTKALKAHDVLFASKYHPVLQVLQAHADRVARYGHHVDSHSGKANLWLLFENGLGVSLAQGNRIYQDGEDFEVATLARRGEGLTRWTDQEEDGDWDFIGCAYTWEDGSITIFRGPPSDERDGKNPIVGHLSPHRTADLIDRIACGGVTEEGPGA